MCKNVKKNIMNTTEQQPKHNHNSTMSPNLKAGILLVVFVLAAYLPALKCGYIWDDNTNITSNSLLHNWEGLKKIWTEPKSIPQGHYWPIIYTSFWVEYHIWGLNPYGYHFVNIILHVINVLLLWVLFKKLRIPGAWIGAAIFALHPVHVESVAWITERKNVLSAMFYLLAFITYINHEEKNRLKFYFISLVIFVLALLSKTITITFPVAILICLYWKKDKLKVKDFLKTIPFFTVAFVISLLCLWVYRTTYPVESTFSIFDKFIIAGRSLWFYAGKLILPINLIAVYPRWEINSSAIWQYLYPIGFIGVIVALWFYRKKIGKGPLAGVLFFSITLAPLLNIIALPAYTEITFVNDHAQYLPSIGLIALFTALVIHLKVKFHINDKQSIAAVSVLLIIFGGMTFHLSGFYKDMETLFKHSIAKNPNAWAAHNNLGLALADKGKLDEAIYHYNEAIKIKPDFAKALYNLGNTYSDIGQYEKAIEYYKGAVTYDPNYTMAINNMGVAYANMNDFEKAISSYNSVLEIDPNNIDAYNNMGNALAQNGKYKEAIDAYAGAIKIDQSNLDVRYNLANAFILEGNTLDGISEYKKALEINPNNLVTILKLSWLLSTTDYPLPEKEREESLTLAEKAFALSGKANHPVILDTLGAAYASIEKYDNAVKCAEKALELTQKSNNAQSIEGISKRLELYKQNLPYREKVK